MKKMTKALLAAGGAALICGGAVMTYLKAQTPMSAQEELTLANLEAMADDLDEGFDKKPGIILLPCADPGFKCVFKCIAEGSVGLPRDCTVDGLRNL